MHVAGLPADITCSRRTMMPISLLTLALASRIELTYRTCKQQQEPLKDVCAPRTVRRFFSSQNVVSKWVKLRVFVRNLRQIHPTTSEKAHYTVEVPVCKEHTYCTSRDNEVSPYTHCVTAVYHISLCRLLLLLPTKLKIPFRQRL
jgi:hypothetical protein